MYMGRIYNVVFEGTNAPETASSKVYYYDWGVLPDGQYKVTFSFSSRIQTLTNTTVANIFMDLGQFLPQATVNGSTPRIDYLGSLKYSGTGTNQFLFAGVTDNPPIYLNTRPMNNNVHILIQNNTVAEQTYGIVNDAYTLCLSFEYLG